jgi:alpha-mannosidase
MLSIVLLLAAPAAAADSSGVTKQALPPVHSGGTQPDGIDLSQGHTLYCVGYSHLDTEWRWAFPQVIREFLPKTLHDNFALFEKYPDYIFNFTGANRYMLMKEYYPNDYAKLKQYVAAGRWVPNGSSMEEGDVNVPSAESLIRQVLYGNRFFEHEFGQSSAEFMLPDCFGFPASFPSILAHCGLKGFSTQKLTWGSAVGIPFNVGVWEGPDGKGVIAALNPGAYVGEVTENLSESSDWLKRIDANGKASGVYTDYHYFGTGDTGGAPSVGSVEWIEQSLHSAGPVKVVSGRADQMFLDITPQQEQGLPRYKGDLLLTQHSAGSITSQNYMKRWNHQNELLADAAEKAAVTAAWLGGPAYPQAKLNEAWRLALSGQFHDQLPGTASPAALEYALNNEVLALNQFADVLQTSVGAVSSGLDTSGDGVPLVVYNPLPVDRQDVVEATVEFPDGAIPQGVRVVGPDGQETPAQVASQVDHSVKLLFLASAPSAGWAVYHAQPLTAPVKAAGTLHVTTSSIESGRYRVKLNTAGDVTSIYDKTAKRELLSAPARLAFMHDQPGYWPAWNMDWEQANKPPVGYVGGPAKIRVVEDGPVRATVEVVRSAQGSQFTQRISLSAGSAGDRVEFRNHINWRGKAVNLKAVFPLTVSNPEATYNWEVGTIERGNDDPKKYEVPSHQWFDLTDKSGGYGVTVLCPFKYGSDKPNDNTLRLTLLRTPGPVLNKDGTESYDYKDEIHQDWGINDITYGVAGHSGDWRGGGTDWQALRLEQPLLAFQCPAHGGALGKSLSTVQVGSPNVRLLALKKAEDNGELVARVVELNGQPQQGVTLSFAAPVVSAREVDGQEHDLGPAQVVDGKIVADFTPYQLHSYALTLAAPPASIAAPQSQPVALPYNASLSSNNGEAASGGFDSDGRCLAAEMLPAQLHDAGVDFTLAPHGHGQLDGVTCAGQTIALPAGDYNRLYLLAASSPDTTAEFKVGDGPAQSLTIQDWGGFIGQPDTREWDGDIAETVYEWTYPLTGLAPGYIKRAPVAWYASHRHDPWGQNDIYGFSYLYRYSLDVPAGATTLTLPNSPSIHILAISAARNPAAGCRPAQPLYDTMEGHTAEAVRLDLSKPAPKAP